jgi:hypothetical protein
MRVCLFLFLLQTVMMQTEPCFRHCWVMMMATREQQQEGLVAAWSVVVEGWVALAVLAMVVEGREAWVVSRMTLMKVR